MSIMKQEKVAKDLQKTWSKEEKSAAVEKLITARIGLLFRHPFFGNMATRLTLVEASDWLPTIATDGRRFFYNIGFVNKLTPKECEFGFAHEVLHNVFNHMIRRENRDPMISNIAADFAVNQVLKDDKIGVPPSFIKIFQDDKFRGKSYEEIYDHLMKNTTIVKLNAMGELLDEHCEVGGGSGDGEEEGDSEGNNKGKLRISKEEAKEIQDEVREAFISAVQTTGSGKLSASLMRLYKELTESKMDWRQLLRQQIQSLLKSDFSWSRYNRKAQHTGAILPGMINDVTVDVSVALDMSGSITDKMIKDFLSEVKGIMEEFDDFKLDLWCFDTSVHAYRIFTGESAEEIYNYQPKGGGGTLFECNYQFMKDNDIEPKKFIMFTDGYPNNTWGDENYADTLFVIVGNDTIVPPYGTVAYYSE